MVAQNAVARNCRKTLGIFTTAIGGALIFASGAVIADADISVLRTLAYEDDSCPGASEINITRGSSVRVCYRVTNTSTAGESLANVKITDNSGTSSASDDFLVKFNSPNANWTGLTDLDGDGRNDDLAAGVTATASVVLSYNSFGTYRGRAQVKAEAITGSPLEVKSRSISTVGVIDKGRKMKFSKTVTRPSGTCPGFTSLAGVRVGEQVRYCYEVRNKGDFDLNNILIVDTMGTSVKTDDQTISLSGLKNLDNNGADDLMPGATAHGSILAVMPASQGEVRAKAKVTSDGVKKLKDTTSVNVDSGLPSSCRLEMKATKEDDTLCSAGSKLEDVDAKRARYCYRVTNTGTSSMTGMVIKDTEFSTDPLGEVSFLGAGQTSQWFSQVDFDITSTYDDHTGKATGLLDGVKISCVGDGATALRRGSRVGANNQRGFLTRTAMLTDGNCRTSTEQYDDITVPRGTKVWFCYKVSHSYTNQAWPQDEVEKGGGELDLIDTAVDPDRPILEFTRSIAVGETQYYKFGPVTVNKTLHNTAYLFSPLFHAPVFQTYFYIYDNSTVRVARGDLRLTSTASSNYINTNNTDTVTVTVNVDNDGLSDAQNAKVRQVLPSGVTFVSASSSLGSCLYKPNKSRVDCKLGDLAGGASAVVTMTVRSNTSYGTYKGTTCVTSKLVEGTLADNCDRSTVYFHTGATREASFWANNQTAMASCTAQGPIDVGFATIASETVDNQLDAITLPTTGSVSGDSDLTTSTATQFALGILNASTKELISGAVRTGQAQQCLKGAAEILAAVCNTRVFGATYGGFNIADQTNTLRKACVATTNTTKIANRTAKAKKVKNLAKRFNKSGARVATGVGVSTTNPLGLSTDDPTDPRD